MGGAGHLIAVNGPAASQAFSAHAEQYTALRRRLVPGFDAFYTAAVQVLHDVAGDQVRRVLDLGAGTGLLSSEIADVYPDARFDLLDASEPMLAEARERLGEALGTVLVADMAQGLPDGPYDAIVSALAIHHLSDEDKRALLKEVHARLTAGGVFVNAEQVIGPTPRLTELYEHRWETQCRALGATDEELTQTHERMRHDRCCDVETQLTWLREVGFADADCAYRSGRFAVLFGIKGTA